jgi:hypothetical protein
VILGPGGLLGLPPGVPSPTWDVAWWRDLLVLVSLAAAWCEARARRGAALVFAILFALLAVGFWVAALARPYGLLIDAPTTAWAADVAVAGWAGGGDRFLAGETAASGGWTFLARHLRPELVLLIPTVMPLIVVPAASLAIAGLWGNREARLAAILWIGAATGALDVARGAAFVPLLWSRPRASLLWVATAAAVFVVARVRVPARVQAVLGALVVLAWTVLGRSGPDLGLADTAWALTLDSHLWLALGAVGLRRTRDPAASTLVGGGALLALVRAAGGPGDVWAGAAFCRLGLVLAAAPTVEAIASGLASGFDDRFRRAVARLGLLPDRLPQAVVVALVLAGGFLAWWDPARTDPIARGSLEPVSDTLMETMHWLRTNTPVEAVVLADDYAAAIPVLAGRRVLRAPGLLTAPDEERRLRLERTVLAGQPSPALLQRYGLRYVFIAPGQFRSAGIVEPEDLDRRDGLRLAYQNAKGMRVYEIVSGAPAPDEGRREGIK